MFQYVDRQTDRQTDRQIVYYSLTFVHKYKTTYKM